MNPFARRQTADGLAAVVLAVIGGLVIRWWYAVSQVPKAIRSFDMYQHYFSNALYSAASVRRGGVGLFWNALNNCGQPFFGIGSMAVLYPGNVFFLLLEPGWALYAILVFNLAVAAISAYGLGRVLGLGPLGALSVGVTFAFGNANVDLFTWSPLVENAYVWLPAAMLCCERLLQHPTPGRAVAFGAVLAVMLLGGFPQHVLLAYQLIGLRLLWALVTRELGRPVLAVVLAVCGLVLGPLLAAVVLVPNVEMAMLSVRGHALSTKEVMPQGFLTMAQFRALLAMRSDIYNPFRLMPWVLFLAAPLRPGSRRVALFYLFAGLVYFDLSFGENGYLFTYYQGLPGVSLFRDPARCMWVTAFCLAVLTGIAVDAYVASDTEPRGRTTLLVAIPVAGIVGYYFFWPNRLTVAEAWLAAGTVVAVLFGRLPRLRLAGGALLATVLALDLLVVRPKPFRRLIPDWTLLRSHADVFEWLRTQHRPQDRIYVVGEHDDYSLMPKTPALFGLPSVTDYEPQPGLRWSEFYVRMRSGASLQTLNDFYYCLTTEGFRRRLLDLTGARYVVAGVPPAKMVGLPAWTLFPVHVSGGVTVYENTTALPRARWVPRLVVVPDPTTLLARLSLGPDDLRVGALVEATPASGFFGDDGPATGSKVTFVTDDFEHVVLRVEAPRRGFLVLADQDFPGWRATVNGASAEIIRANYTFRAVEVPAGESVVEFRYAPGSVRLGAAVSALTVLALLVGGFARRRRLRVASLRWPVVQGRVPDAG